MKKLYTLAIIVLLAGCSWFAPEFDNVEYKEFVELNTHAHYLQSECGSNSWSNPERLQQMKFKSATLLTYASHLRDNAEVIEFIKIIDNDINHFTVDPFFQRIDINRLAEICVGINVAFAFGCCRQTKLHGRR